MNDAAGTLERRYSEALKTYLTQSSEMGLHTAYALGREAAADGVGVVDIAMLHYETLGRMLAESGVAPTMPMIGEAAQFLAECLSSFEMMLLGYRESIAKLVETNERLHEAKAALEMVNQELEAFSYSVAHDLRAPLRSVDGFSLALLEDHSDRLDDEGRRYLHHLRSAARDMTRLIDNLLTLSRVSRGDLQREDVDLSDLARQVAARLTAEAPERLVTIAIEPGLTARCDPRLLAIALENLIGNAWKFTSKGADAHIEVGRLDAGGQPTYFVRDNGAGFDMAYAAKLFGAFQRLHSATEFEGTGIGLATVQRVIRRHGGSIRAEGAIGRGATFSFTLGEEWPGDPTGATQSQRGLVGIHAPGN